jgi:hypothetical protein
MSETTLRRPNASVNDAPLRRDQAIVAAPITVVTG